LFLGSACKNFQFYRPYQPHSIAVRPNEPMKLKAKQNKEFAKWFGDWIELIEQNRASVDRVRPEKTASVDGPENSDGACLLGPKRRVASGRYVA
jgi:hypothetical protein